MQGKKQRTEGTDFLGQPYKTITCPNCKVKMEVMSIDNAQLCGPCANPDLEEYLDQNMDYSKSFNECFKDQARLVREWNDKSKHS